MTTHFHMLARSPRGVLSQAMRRIQNDYVRWFNRRHKRDGPLVRGRFWSKPVRSDEYMRNLVRYIDDNPVKGGVLAVSTDYPYGSARIYAGMRRCPPWLNREWVRGEVGADARGTEYRDVFGGGLPDRWTRLIEARMSSAAGRPDAFDLLVAAAPPRVRREGIQMLVWRVLVRIFQRKPS